MGARGPFDLANVTWYLVSYTHILQNTSWYIITIDIR